MPNLFNPQDLNRFSYVRNNPLRYNDPTGHMLESDDYECHGCTLPPQPCSTCSGGGGNPHDDDDLVPNPGCIGCTIPIGEIASEYTIGPTPPQFSIGPTSLPACASGGMYNCPPALIYPSTLILHPLDSNVIYKVPIYDNSYYPPKPIGYTTIYYAKDGGRQIGPWAVFGMVAEEAGLAAVKHFVIGEIKEQLAGLGMTLAGCPECTLLFEGYQVLDNIANVNNAITIESHLRTETVYFPSPSPLMPPEFSGDFIYRKIK